MNLTSILPEKVDNVYRGNSKAFYCFVFIVGITLVRSLIHIFSFDGGAESIASIPLHSYTLNAQNAIIQLFALWGTSQLLFGIFYAIVLYKYKSLIPLMYCFIFAEYSIRLFVGLSKPIETEYIPPGAYANFLMPVISLILLYLSTISPKTELQ